MKDETVLPPYPSLEAYLEARGAGVEEDGAAREVRERVAQILARVRLDGDDALLALTAELDGVSLDRNGLRIRPDSLQRVAARAPDAFIGVLERAEANIRRYHERQKESGFEIRLEDGSVLGQRVTPLASVGVYVPGGAASYPSSVLMNVIPARIAGVERIVAVTPPGALERSPELAAALARVAPDEVYAVGGAQAIAALAYGTETIRPVDKIVGPGNAYVAEAKRAVFGRVGIDAVAGPSEIVVLADETADPRYVAADLLSQAEHGSGDERALLVTPSAELARAVVEAMVSQLESLPRAAAVRDVLRRNGASVVVNDLDEAVTLVERVAPEHLEIQVAERHEARVLARIRSAGAVFIGPHSPVPLGDFFAGPNHVLPTGTTARFASALGVYDFVKRTSVIHYTKEALSRDRDAIERFARAEGFEAHARAIAIRFEP